ncbi:hypothetical protein SDC9_105226 [bioreactor metagenome]|uniref:Uncharacterized protein n=1 Tax=bioreactor metagenome TaxID=1076179 RepID=A0A645AYS1_9ZZZZ
MPVGINGVERRFAVQLHAEKRVGRRFDPEFELLPGGNLIRELKNLLAVIFAENRTAGEAEIRDAVPEKQRFAVQVHLQRDRPARPRRRNLGGHAEPAAVPGAAPFFAFADRPVFAVQPSGIGNRLRAMPEFDLHRQGFKEKLLAQPVMKTAGAFQIKIEFTLLHGQIPVLCDI